MTDTTIAGGTDFHDPEVDERSPSLTIVHHPDPRHLGVSRPLRDRELLLLGRDEHCPFPALAEDGRTSRRHAEIRRAGPRVEVIDLGSRNGTTVNDEQVDGHRILEEGDLVGIGGVLLYFGPRRHRLHLPSDSEIIGHSEPMLEVHDQIDAVAGRDTTVLILGETGTGKELVAREIHSRSGRTGAFVPVNCGALSDGVHASELFGHTKGAFSGADSDRAGLVASAEGGTLFLDEIGDASTRLQVSLLRLLQEREVRAVGADQTQKADVRFIAATNRDLTSDAACGLFRQDLLTRLERWLIRTPPLRARPDDIPILAAAVAQRHGGPSTRVSRRLALELIRYDWPGNVRELSSTIERLVVEARSAEVLRPPRWLIELFAARSAENADSATISNIRAPDRPDAGRRKRPSRDELEQLLVEHRGNVKAVAGALRIGRNTLYRWMKSEGLDAEVFRR